jgi:hypothetical protein
MRGFCISGCPLLSRSHSPPLRGYLEEGGVGMALLLGARHCREAIGRPAEGTWRRAAQGCHYFWAPVIVDRPWAAPPRVPGGGWRGDVTISGRPSLSGGHEPPL